MGRTEAVGASVVAGGERASTEIDADEEWSLGDRIEEHNHVVEEMPQQEREECIHVEEKRPRHLLPCDDGQTHRTHDVSHYPIQMLCPI